VINVPGIKPGNSSSPSSACDIFLGKIAKWNDPAIAALNKGLKLPDQGISVVHRSDGSELRLSGPTTYRRSAPTGRPMSVKDLGLLASGRVVRATRV